MSIFLFFVMLFLGFSGQFLPAIGVFILAMLAHAWETR